MHDWWNLVSRSDLAVESGLYYWVVESATRTQMGKLVILK
jgi:glucose dehydrogenase